MAEFTWTRTVTREETGTVDIEPDDLVARLAGYVDVEDNGNGYIKLSAEVAVEDIYDEFGQDIEWEADEYATDESDVVFKGIEG